MISCAKLCASIALSAAPILAQTSTDVSAPKLWVDVEPKAQLSIEPARAEIGAALVWTLAVETSLSARITLPDLKSLPREWALVETLGVHREASSTDPARRVTTASWRVMSLDAGDVEPPRLKVEVEDHGAKKTIEAATSKITIEHALDASEDAPRASKRFRPIPNPKIVSPRGVVSVLVLCVLGLAAWLLRRRLRRKPAAAPAITPLVGLAQLEERAKAEPESSREVTYALTRLLRDAVDAFVSQPSGSLTDSVWTARIESDERVPSGVRTVLARVLGSAERVKYAQESPSRFALDETLKDARSALEALAAAPKPAASIRSEKEAA